MENEFYFSFQSWKTVTNMAKCENKQKIEENPNLFGVLDFLRLSDPSSGVAITSGNSLGGDFSISTICKKCLWNKQSLEVWEFLQSIFAQ